MSELSEQKKKEEKEILQQELYLYDDKTQRQVDRIKHGCELDIENVADIVEKIKGLRDKAQHEKQCMYFSHLKCGCVFYDSDDVGKRITKDDIITTMLGLKGNLEYYNTTVKDNIMFYYLIKYFLLDSRVAELDYDINYLKRKI